MNLVNTEAMQSIESPWSQPERDGGLDLEALERLQPKALPRTVSFGERVSFLTGGSYE